MFRWKTSEQILNPSKDGEFFDENWMNFRYISQYAPKPKLWNANRLIRFEDVDLWEVISEASGPIGVYASYQPYEEFYIVTKGWKIVAEFQGCLANNNLENYLIANSILYPKGFSLTNTV